MATQMSNAFKYEALKALASGTCKIALMASGFTFNRATHKLYSDISGSELPTANGYTVGGATLSGASASQDDANNRGKCTWSNPSWNVITANLVAKGAIIYYTTAAGAYTQNTIVGYIDFGSDQTTLPGGTFTIASPMVEID